MNIFARKLMLASALVSSVTALPVAANAQTTNLDTAAGVCARFAATASIAQTFFGRCSIVAGVNLTSAQWEQLRSEGILVISTFRQDRIDREAAEHGWRSNEVRREMDKVSGEGNTITVFELDAEGLRRTQNIKGIDVSQNAFRVTGWSFAGDSDGVPMYDQMVFNENWQSIFAKTASMALGNLAAGAGTAAIGNATRSSGCNGSRCNTGGGNVFNLSATATGGDADAAAGAQANGEATINQSGTPTPNPCHGQNGPTC